MTVRIIGAFPQTLPSGVLTGTVSDGANDHPIALSFDGSAPTLEEVTAGDYSGIYYEGEDPIGLQVTNPPGGVDVGAGVYVGQQSNAWLYRNADLGPSAGTAMTFYFDGIIHDLDVARIAVLDGNASRGLLNHMGGGEKVQTQVGGFDRRFDFDVDVRFRVLWSITLDSGFIQLTSKRWVLGSGWSTTTFGTSGSVTSEDFAHPINIGAFDGSAMVNMTLYRMLMAKQSIDLDAAVAAETFIVASDGSPQVAADAQSLFGNNLLFDLYGPASEYNAGKNQATGSSSSIGDFSKSGTFLNAA